MTDYTDLIARMCQTRADMLGTQDEQHYHDCHAAADALEAQARRIAELEAQNEFIMSANNELSWALRERNEALSRIAALEAALKPFSTIPTHGEFGGPLVQARVYYECEPNDRCGVVHIDKTAFRAARAAYLGEKE